VSNGNKVFVSADGRTAWAKRFRDLVADHASDLGGSDNLSQSQKALVRRAAALGIELERMEGDLAEGRAVDLDLFGRLSGHQRRILETLGIERRKKDLAPTLAQYRAQRQAGAP